MADSWPDGALRLKLCKLDERLRAWCLRPAEQRTSKAPELVGCGLNPDELARFVLLFNSVADLTPPADWPASPAVRFFSLLHNLDYFGSTVRNWEKSTRQWLGARASTPYKEWKLTGPGRELEGQLRAALITGQNLRREMTRAFKAQQPAGPVVPSEVFAPDMRFETLDSPGMELFYSGLGPSIPEENHPAPLALATAPVAMKTAPSSAPAPPSPAAPRPAPSLAAEQPPKRRKAIPVLVPKPKPAIVAPAPASSDQMLREKRANRGQTPQFISANYDVD